CCSRPRGSPPSLPNRRRPASSRRPRWRQLVSRHFLSASLLHSSAGTPAAPSSSPTGISGLACTSVSQHTWYRLTDRRIRTGGYRQCRQRSPRGTLPIASARSEESKPHSSRSASLHLGLVVDLCVSDHC